MVNLKKWKNICLQILFLFSLKGLSYSQQGVGFDVSSSKSGERVEISLNGTWDFLPVKFEKVGKPSSFPPEEADWSKINVPSWWEMENPKWRDFDCAWYRKAVKISGSPLDEKQIILRMGMVNYQCYVFINRKFAGQHFGDFVPVKINLTENIMWGETNEILIYVINWTSALKEGCGFTASDVVTERKKGFSTQDIVAPYKSFYNQAWGIRDDVTLISRSKIFIEDIFIKTFVKEKQISLEVTIKNDDKIPHKIKVCSRVEKTKIKTSTDYETIKPGSSKTFLLEKHWKKVKLWQPGNPYLYDLVTKIVDEDKTIDECKTRFGFREFTIDKNHFKINGKKIRLYADQCCHHLYPSTHYKYMWKKEDMRELFRYFKSLNMNSFRLHCEPAKDSFLEVADEEGFLILYDSFLSPPGMTFRIKEEKFWENAEKLLGKWVKSQRNHPSIVIWAISNEQAMEPYLKKGKVTEEDIKNLKELGLLVKSLDPTRPIIYTGDGDFLDFADVISLHYPCDYSGIWPITAPFPFYWPEKLEDGIYRGYGSAGMKVNMKQKPVCITEFNYNANPKSASLLIKTFKPFKEDWWQANWSMGKLMIEAFRYCDIAGIFPYDMEARPPANKDQRQAYTPQAVFIKEYNKTFFGNRKIGRTLTIYNDVLKDSVLSCKWDTRMNDKIVQSEKIKVVLGPFEFHHRELILDMPEVKNSEKLTLTLRLYDGKRLVYKAGKDYWVFPSDLKVDKKVNERKIGIFSSGPFATEIDYFKDSLNKFRKINLHFKRLRKPDKLSDLDLVVIDTNSLLDFQKLYPVESVRDFIEGGGKLLCLQQNTIDIGDWFGQPLTLTNNASSLNFVFAEDHPLLNDIKMNMSTNVVENAYLNDLSFWGKDHVVSRGSLPKIEGDCEVVTGVGGSECFGQATIMVVKKGKGECIFTQMDLMKKIDEEPIARKILINIIEYLTIGEKN